MDVDNRNYYQEDGKAKDLNTYFSKDFQPGLNRAERRKLERQLRKTIKKEKRIINESTQSI